jgi:hypothetical protein
MRLHLDLNVNAIKLLECQPVALLPLLWAALLAREPGPLLARKRRTPAGLERRSPCDRLLPMPGAAGGGRVGGRWARRV